jgi:hypothetical protein
VLDMRQQAVWLWPDPRVSLPSLAVLQDLAFPTCICLMWHCLRKARVSLNSQASLLMIFCSPTCFLCVVLPVASPYDVV